MIHLVTVGTSLNTSKDEFLVQLLREALSSSRWDPVVQRLIDLQGAVCVSRRQEGTDPLPQELSYLHLCPPKPNADPNRVRPIVLGAQAGKKGGFASDLERSGPVLRSAGIQILIDEESLVGPTLDLPEGRRGHP